MIKITDIKAGDTVKIKFYGKDIPRAWSRRMGFFQGYEVVVNEVNENFDLFSVLKTDGSGEFWIFNVYDIEEIITNEQEEIEQIVWDFTTNIFENGFD